MKINPILLLFLLGGAASAAPIPLTGNTTYTQNFNALAVPTAAGDAAAATTWTDDVTISGWYLYRAGNGAAVPGFAGTNFAYRYTDGSAGPTVGNLYSMGVASNPDRAFATPSTTAAGEMAGIAVFHNTSVKVLELTNLAYNAEVLRTNNGAANTESITVWYNKAATQAALLTLTQAATTAAVYPTTKETGPNANYITGWTRLSEMDYTLPAQTPGVVNLTTPISAAPTTAVRVNPGEFFAVRWGNVNSAGTDADMGIDDVSLTFAEVNVATISATPATAIVRNENGPGLADDTVTFNTTVTGAGGGPSWTATGATPAAGAFGAVTMTIPAPLPTGSVNVTFADVSNGAVTATIPVAIPARYVIGQKDFGAGLVDVNTDITIGQPAAWINDPALRTLAMTTGVAADSIVTSEAIDLTSVGAVGFSAKFRIHETSTGSNLEVGDRFKAELIYTVGGTPITVNLVSQWDTGAGGASTAAPGTPGAPNGYINGYTGAAGTDFLNATVYAAAADDYNANKSRDEFNQQSLNAADLLDHTFDLAGIVPANADSVVLKVYGAGIAGSEFFDVTDILFQLSTVHSLSISAASGSRRDHHNTDTATDDTYYVPVNVSVSNPPVASTGWTQGNSDISPGLGAYSLPNPVRFESLTNAAATLTLTDNSVPTVISNTLSMTPPAAPTLTATAATITRIPNGAGLADDTVTFVATITDTDGSPHFALTAPSPMTVSAPSYTLSTTGATVVTVTLSNVPDHGNVLIGCSDVGYPAAAATMTIAIPNAAATNYVIGQKNLGAGLSDVISTGALPTQWFNYPASRLLEMNTNADALDRVVTGEVLDLSTVGAVNFSAHFRARDTSLTSNFETGDKFKAELIIVGGASAGTVNLITPFDEGDGAPGTGANGAANGYLNGYTSSSVADYDTFVLRDELNGAGSPAATLVNHEFNLSHVIPADADSVQLVVTGAGINGSEFFQVYDVLFTTSAGPVDTDLDGMTDAYEDANGLDKNNPADKFLDKDGDGQSNFAEFCAGTGANDPASSLKIISIVPGVAAGTYDVTWSSVAGKTYQAQESTDLGVADVWANIGATVASGGATTTVNIPVAGGGPLHFLRIKTVP